MGAVYRALDSRSGRPRAVKRLVDAAQLPRFEVEARMLQALSHPRVVEIVDHFGEGSDYYIVMSLADGRDLAEELRSQGGRGLDADLAMGYVEQAAEALAYVHEQQIIHRDVKPANLVHGTDGVVLVDFGIARPLALDAGTTGIGSPGYVAPETFAFGLASPASDVYGLAATTHALLTGHPPRPGGGQAVAGIAAEHADAIRAGCAYDERARPQTVGEFVAALGGKLPVRSAGVGLGRSAAESGGLQLTAVARTGAGVFGAAAASIALIEGEELHYVASWGAGAEEITGRRLPLRAGIAGDVATRGIATAVPDCRSDPRFARAVAEATGYIPHTMVVAPMLRAGAVCGVLTVLDRRDGTPFGDDDLDCARLFAELAVDCLAM